MPSLTPNDCDEELAGQFQRFWKMYELSGIVKIKAENWLTEEIRVVRYYFENWTVCFELEETERSNALRNNWAALLTLIPILRISVLIVLVVAVVSIVQVLVLVVLVSRVVQAEVDAEVGNQSIHRRIEVGECGRVVKTVSVVALVVLAVLRALLVDSLRSSSSSFSSLSSSLSGFGGSCSSSSFSDIHNLSILSWSDNCSLNFAPDRNSCNSRLSAQGVCSRLRIEGAKTLTVALLQMSQFR